MKVKVYASLGYVGCKTDEILDIPDEYMKDMREEDREKFIADYAEEWLWGNSGLDFGWEVLEEVSDEV